MNNVTTDLRPRNQERAGARRPPAVHTAPCERCGKPSQVDRPGVVVTFCAACTERSARLVEAVGLLGQLASIETRLTALLRNMPLVDRHLVENLRESDARNGFFFDSRPRWALLPTVVMDFDEHPRTAVLPADATE